MQALVLIIIYNPWKYFKNEFAYLNYFCQRKYYLAIIGGLATHPAAFTLSVWERVSDHTCVVQTGEGSFSYGFY
jgi:hypothetical protein